MNRYDELPLVLIIENSKSCQELYLMRLHGIARVKQAFSIEVGARTIGQYFREGTILVIDGTLESHLDGLRLLEIAKRVEKQEHFFGVIIAGSTSEEDNLILCKAGCTHNPITKIGILPIINNLIIKKEREGFSLNVSHI